MSSWLMQVIVGTVIAIIGWFINDKLKSIKDDTSAVRDAVNAHERRIQKVEKVQERLEGILIGKGCLDSKELPCVKDSAGPSDGVHVSHFRRGVA